MSALEFIRDIGKTFRINSMIHKDSISERLKTEEGMSFTEFSYSLLQAYDFERLFVKHVSNFIN